MRPSLVRRTLPAALVLAGLSTPALAANAGDTAKFTLDHVTFVGNSRVPTDTLNSVVGLSPGDKVDRAAIVQAFDNVVAEYKKDNVGGSIDPKMTYPHAGHMNLTFNITEEAAPVVTHVQPVLDHETITGNAKLTTAQLAPALTMKPGAAVDTTQIIADRDAIAAAYKGAKMGVSINPKVSYPTPGHVDLNFEVIENPPPAAK